MSAVVVVAENMLQKNIRNAAESTVFGHTKLQVHSGYIDPTAVYRKVISKSYQVGLGLIHVHK